MPEGYGRTFNGMNADRIAANNRSRGRKKVFDAARNDPTHEHEWDEWNTGDSQGRTCKTCDTSQVKTSKGWL